MRLIAKSAAELTKLNSQDEKVYKFYILMCPGVQETTTLSIRLIQKEMR